LPYLFFSFILIGLSAFCILVAAIGHFFISRNYKKVQFLGGSFLILGLILLSSFAGYKWAKHDVRITCDKGKGLVQCLEEYRKTVGQYPNSLKLLVPKYIEKVPRTAIIGSPPFRYRIYSNGQNFSLGFDPPTCIDPMFSWFWDHETKHFWSQD